MGRKKLDESTNIKYQTIRINSTKYPYLIDFLRDNDNTNNLICTLLQHSPPFLQYAEKRKKGGSDAELDGYYEEDPTPVLVGFFDN